MLYRDPIAMYRNLIWHINVLYTISGSRFPIENRFSDFQSLYTAQLNANGFYEVLGQTLKGLSLVFRDQGLGLGVGVRV